MKHKKQKLIEDQYTLKKASFPLKYIWVLVFVFIIMTSIGYAAMNQELQISGEAVFRVEADIRITDLKLLSATNGGIEEYNSRYGKSEVITGVTLPSLNSTVTYKVTVTNFVDIVMMLETINKANFNNDDIEYVLSDISVGSTVQGISTTTFQITFKYKSTVNSIPDNTRLDANIQFNFVPVPLPVLAEITATEGQSKMNTIDLTLDYTNSADKLYYVAVDSSSGYVPTDSQDLINFVLNGTNSNLSNSSYNTSPHIARGIVNINGSVDTYPLSGLEQNISSDAGVVGGIKYDIYACLVNSSIAGIVSNMESLGYYQLAQGFDSGFGTSGNPYVIKSGTALSHMNYSEYNTNQDLYYQMKSNVNLSGFGNWTSIGNASTPFVGTFDGGGFAISNLTINNATATEIGLFGASEGIIQNVGIASGSISSTNTSPTKTGGLVGDVLAGSITNCYSSASVSGGLMAAGDTGYWDGIAGTGGLIGTVSGTTSITISNSYSTGSVVGRQDVGGFVGNTIIGSKSNISKCYSTGDVTINLGYHLGGFIGKEVGNATVVSDCYSTGTVTSNSNNSVSGGLDRTGGFAGWFGDTTSGSSLSVSNCYASGDVISNCTVMGNTNSGIGGFVGAMANVSASVKNCLALNDTVTTASTQLAKTGKFIGYRLGATPTFSNNYANSAMNTNGTSTTVTGNANLNITGYNLDTMLLQSFFTGTALWNTSIWNITDGEFPTLK